jgi:D-glycero-D-manno-heptose 1,7-bisphosphate phosphatase
MTYAPRARASSPRPAAFFDRDGVLNVDINYLHRPEDLVWNEGAADAVRLCNEAGFLVFIVTNQSGVARGYYDENAVQALHAHMTSVLCEQGATIDDIRYCPHHVDAVHEVYRKDCECRKPKPGMLLSLMRDWNIDAARSFLIGDTASDMSAAAAAGIRGILYTGGPLDLLARRAVEEAGP